MKKTLSLEECAHLIKAMPIDQAMQQIKSDISGLPGTQIIDGELVVSLVVKKEMPQSFKELANEKRD